ncbi:MAG: hypothetical protein JRF62_12720 [Deltaproteobacteria bacterium]|nr:hypothetical protein [Deltaproteobacteria bacterium]MBW2641315.1 hypothetical protein [Deltaproteobacteria bacterium]MBW2680855.1 hypothetical protein [Deltaproteobacteria bacterium]
MSQRAEKLAERLRIFNTQVVTFVENCTQENWHKICGREDWTIGVVARHIGAGHYDIMKWPSKTLDSFCSAGSLKTSPRYFLGS